MTVLLIEPALAAKPKRVITGDEAEMFDAWVKAKDGTEYGFGVSKPEDIGWLFKIIVAQVVVWVGMLGFKIYDRVMGKGDQMGKDMREMKEAWLTAAHDIRYLKEHAMTEAKVSAKVREEIRYLKEHGSFIETPSRRSGSREG